MTPPGPCRPLSGLLSPRELAAHLPDPGVWRPFPALGDPAWERLGPAVRHGLAEQARRTAGTPWPGLPASLFAGYVRTGDRLGFERPYFERRRRLAAAVLAAGATGDERLLDEVRDGVWLLCEESTWCLPAHEEFAREDGDELPDPDRPFVDLFAAESAALLAWTDLVAGDALDASGAVVRRRLRREVRHRLLTPYLARHWHWYGDQDRPVNNWNPWIHSNTLVCALLLSESREAMLETIVRAVRGLDVFVAAYGPDGGCEEGVSYWWRAAACLVESLETLRSAGAGRLDAFTVPVVREMVAYLHRMHIDGDWYVNFADGKAHLPDQTALDIPYRAGLLTGDDDVVAHARARRRTGPPVVHQEVGLGRTLAGLFDAGWRDATPDATSGTVPGTAPGAVPDAVPDAVPGTVRGTAPYVEQVWLPSVQVMVARERRGSPGGLFLAAKGGHNAESHNHNDVGSFIVALDGRPVLVDAGVGDYTARTFGPDRYGIWTMQSSYHNLPEVDGVMQAPGPEHRARDVSCTLSGDRAGLSLDLAAAWPEHAGVREWRRTLRLLRGDGAAVVVEDRWELRRSPSRLALCLMAHGEVTVSPGLISVAGRRRPLLVRHDPAAFTARVERLPLEDSRLRDVWGDHLHRIVLRATTPRVSGTSRLVIEPGVAPDARDAGRRPAEPE
ncbi:heparinase II/III family protein [Streptosporangium sp. NPDC023615]|uniref:heparinase II/III domain-containing protein n=1 Tax=Streptosporangium sp. NPDC023615 TaxID=3154794 RepID=UPI00343193B8